MARPKKTPVKEEGKYQVKFSIGPDVYNVRGDSILDALKKIKPTRYKGIAKIEATTGGKVSSLPLKLFPTKLMRLFAKPIELELFAKRLQTLL